MTLPSCTIGILRLPHAAGIALPAYESTEAAGMDLRAAIPQDQYTILAAMARMAVPTGLAIEIPKGFEGQVRPRSGLAMKHGVTIANAPGTIDSDYRGEVHVILINLGSEPFTIERGMRIAQLVIAPVTQAQIEVVAQLGETGRGRSGFGSTGLK